MDAAITSYIEKLLAEQKLVPEDLVCASLNRRVHPLQASSHKMYHISGPKDPTRYTTCVISTEMVAQQVRSITDSKLPADWKWGKIPLRRTRPAPAEVSSLIFFTFSGIICV